jgi:hypothetical protein
MLDDIARFRGAEFQDFCSRLLSLEDPTFQAVDGSGGDLGNDGFCVRGETLYQAYAPERRSLAKLRAKVEDSFEKARDLRNTAFPKLARLIFLTPFDLTQRMHEHLRATAEASKFTVESWGESRLHALVGKNPAIRPLFSQFLIADVASQLRTALAGQRPALDSEENKQALDRASQESLRWPTRLPRGEALARPELERLASDLRGKERSCFVLLGAPGAGKSAFLAILGEQLASAGMRVVALRCDRLPKDLRRRDELALHLGLTDPVDRVLARIAASTPTVLLVDQLDALCDIVDLQSERLNAILDLLDRARDIEGLRVVAACREFDFRHDTRLSRLDAEAIHLGLPPWDDVAAVLRANGLVPEQFPPKMRELLRVPQQLKVFLSLAGKRDNLESYQGMLEQFWQERVALDPARVALVNRVAERMADEELLTVPTSLADGVQDTLKHLEREGVLRLDDTSRTISFAHQTLFEFARARAFGADRDLVAHVMERQNGVFVRPVLWSALTYLRATSPVSYRRAVAQLWGDATLRIHLRHLLLEFLGQVSDPSEDETELLLGAVRNRGTCSTALNATVGNAAWFSCLYRAGIFVTETLAHAPQAVAMLVTVAVRFDADRVAEIVRGFADSPLYSRIALYVLSAAETWSPAFAALARGIVAQPVDRSALMSLATKASRVAPELAVELVAAALDKTLSAVPPPPAEEISEDSWSPPHHDKGVDAALGLTQHFLELEEVARKAPEATRDGLFPIWVRISERLAARGSCPRAYRHERELDGIADATHPSTLASTLRCALELSASTNPDGFVAFARRFENSDLNGVHAMLSFGFVALPATHQRASLAYLLGDARRLCVKAFLDRDGRTLAVLRALSPSLSAADVPTLERFISASQVSAEGDTAAPVETRRARARFNRRHRLRLLLSLPQHLLSPESARTVREESLVFEDAEAPDGVITSGTVGSPMSATQMESASDDDVLKLFNELVDATDDDHPRRPMLGGSFQASQQLGELAKRVPERVVGILAALRPEDQEMPMTAALSALAEVGFARFDELLLDADARGFASEEFRWQMAHAIGKRALAGAVIPDNELALLERWLDLAPPAAESTREARERTEPLLFGAMGGGILPRGGHPAMRALLCIYLRRQPPAMDLWLAALERRLATAEATSAWAALCHELPRLAWLPDRARVERFFALLFEKHPALLADQWGAYLLAHLATRLDETLVRRWIEAQLGSEDAIAQQAAGELLIVCALHRPTSWVDTELGRLENGDPRASLLVGVAFAAAHTWGDHGTRRVAARWLAIRFAHADGHELEALFSAYGPHEELWSDDAAVEVLRSIERNPAALAAFPDEGLEQLELLVSHKGDFVVHFVTAMLNAMESRGVSPAERFQWSGGTLVDLTLTLQRKSATRVGGMALFERLLALGLSSVRDVLFEIESRPRFDPPAPRMPRRPRARS